VERVAFLIERTGVRLGCLLNPESLVVRRTAGVRPRTSAGGPLTGAGLRDDPLLFTGGGSTTLELDLLFDVSLAGSSVAAEDVRDLTAPLWELAENAPADDGYGRPPLVHFVWGKSWNVAGVVAAVAERLESFTPEGTPQRSWLRMRLLRAAEPGAAEPTPAAAPPALEDLAVPPEGEAPEETTGAWEIAGGGAPEEGVGGERLDAVAYSSYGDPAYWRLLAAFNNIADPLRVVPGTVLQIPRRAAGEGGS
jgi:hypothetical protein